MKKLLVFILMLFTVTFASGQSMVLDTVYFYDHTDPFYRPYVWDLVTYGNADSLKINGLKFYTNSSSTSQLTRHTAYSSGSVNVEALAYGGTVSATVANTNELTVTIPAGVRLISLKVRVSSLSSLKIFMGTTDMGNTSSSNRWMPLVQAWREDTGQQLIGLTCLMDITGVYDKFTINGLINTTACHIRLGF